MKRAFFIGGVGSPDMFGGELTKNKFLIERLRVFVDNLIVVDTYQGRSRPWKLWKFLYLFFFSSDTPIIFSTSYGNISWVHRLLLRFSPNRNMVLWAIGGNLHTALEQGVYSLLDVSRFNHILVEGERIKQGLAKLGITQAIVVPNCKDVSYLADISEKKYYDTSRSLRLVFFSRIIPEKGCRLIIEAAKYINQIGYRGRYQIDFYGPIDSGYKSDFLKAIDQVEEINYRGVLDFTRQKTYETISTYDVSLFPTFWGGEGFPGVIVDSFIAGLPVLVSDWSLNAELIDNLTGFIIPVADIQAIAKVLMDIMEDKYDLEKMSKQAQSRAKLYDYRYVVSEELINNILD